MSMACKCGRTLSAASVFICTMGPMSLRCSQCRQLITKACIAKHAKADRETAIVTDVCESLKRTGLAARDTDELGAILDALADAGVVRVFEGEYDATMLGHVCYEEAPSVI